MRSFIDAFAHQQLDGMQELQRDFGRRRHPRRQAERSERAARVRVHARQAGRVRSWLGHVVHGLAARLHLAGDGHPM